VDNEKHTGIGKRDGPKEKTKCPSASNTWLDGRIMVIIAGARTVEKYEELQINAKNDKEEERAGRRTGNVQTGREDEG